VTTPPWVRIASSVQARVEDPLETRSAFGVRCARLQTIITQRKRGYFWDACFRSICLSPRLHAGSDAYPGALSSFQSAATRHEGSFETLSEVTRRFVA